MLTSVIGNVEGDVSGRSGGCGGGGGKEGMEELPEGVATVGAVLAGSDLLDNVRDHVHVRVDDFAWPTLNYLYEPSPSSGVLLGSARRFGL